MALEALFSKRADRPYRGGRSNDWIKVKKRAHNTYDRVRDAFG
jgi:bifunctional non-homologous end joining protein LigD